MSLPVKIRMHIVCPLVLLGLTIWAIFHFHFTLQFEVVARILGGGIKALYGAA
jgi:hypothetical protein